MPTERPALPRTSPSAEATDSAQAPITTDAPAPVATDVAQHRGDRRHHRGRHDDGGAAEGRAPPACQGGEAVADSTRRTRIRRRLASCWPSAPPPTASPSAPTSCVTNRACTMPYVIEGWTPAGWCFPSGDLRISVTAPTFRERRVGTVLRRAEGRSGGRDVQHWLRGGRADVRRRRSSRCRCTAA